jgi:prolyl-tRNA synthetase
MPTRWTRTLIPTSRQTPTEAEVPSHQLMLRAGLIRRLGTGAYTYLPLGWRALQKVTAIIREEMAAADCQEILMPTLQPLELWQQTGRDEAYGHNLFRLQDRHGRELALGPTHEEVITELIGAYVFSYKDLPLSLFQIQTKFRDEYRPRFGVLRSREFQMKDAYSFHMTLEEEGGLEATYQQQRQAYRHIFERCGLPYVPVEAESGPIGGSGSEEFMVPAPTGEDVILKSDQDNYAANVEKCAIGDRHVGDAFHGAAQPPAAADELETIHTPNCPGIDDVCTFFKDKLGVKLTPAGMLKTLVCQAGDQWVIAVVRGDHELNEGKLRDATGLTDLELADDKEAGDAGFAIGFVGPQIATRRADVTLVIDPDATQGMDWVTGANDYQYHVRHFNWQRDVLEPLGIKPTLSEAKGRIQLADIRNAVDGDPSPMNDGGILRETKGIEVGHVFKLGDKYTRALNVSVLDDQNQSVHPLMGCYGIGVNRILAAAIEREGGSDEAGIIWPAAIAPYQVLITAIKYDDDQVQNAVHDLAAKLEAQTVSYHDNESTAAAGGSPRPIDVLIDDRAERPGVKFNDADLLGIPLRVTVGAKGLANGEIEIKARDGSNGEKGESVKLEDAVPRVKELLKTL